MKTSITADIKKQPVFPAPLSLPLKIIPGLLHSKALVSALNRIFHNDINNRELDFLQDRIIRISIEDIGIEYRFTLHGNKLTPVDKTQNADLHLNGTVYNYLLLATRQEDTDALFFSRRLQMQGDTELGLFVKNYLDGLDMDSHRIPAYLESALQKSLPVYERLFSR